MCGIHCCTTRARVSSIGHMRTFVCLQRFVQHVVRMCNHLCKTYFLSKVFYVSLSSPKTNPKKMFKSHLQTCRNVSERCRHAWRRGVACNCALLSCTCHDIDSVCFPRVANFIDVSKCFRWWVLRIIESFDSFARIISSLCMLSRYAAEFSITVRQVIQPLNNPFPLPCPTAYVPGPTSFISELQVKYLCRDRYIALFTVIV